MELVYLWVEEYKNIRNQGFNFSPKFNCKYDEVKKELEITPKEYISIFPNNINITAIVGENGSGKSSICGELYAEIRNKEINNTKNQLNFIFLIQHNANYYIVSNLENINCNFETICFKIFEELENKKKIFSFVALGEFSTRENHKSGKFVDSIYSILPLQRKVLNKGNTKTIQKSILDKIDFSYKEITIDSRKIGNVNFGKNIPLTKLSFGEKYRILLFSQILEILEKYRTSVIFLDEVMLSFHPKWQKTFISDLINLFSNFNIHFIISSHSPFILSDIPKENIIFLKNGVQVKAMEKKQTFGANIHTLLADGFFMDGGLMGEFARSKIEEVIKFLNGEKSEINSKEEAQRIINIVGEPILKSQLQRMLDSKRVDKIDELEEEIELLKHRLEIMRKNQ